MKFPKPASITMAAMVLLAFSSPAALGVIYVNCNAPGPVSDGTSWETAFPSVQQAMIAASSGSEIWVAAGRYVERITLKPEVRLYGGFAGTETARTQRDPSANETTLDGDSKGSVVTVQSGATTATVIDGFTITNGYLTKNHTGGAGICCSGASPTISNNRIIGNSAIIAYGGGGGGIYSLQSSPVVTDNIICGNSSGILCGSASAVITNNEISGNSGTGVKWVNWADAGSLIQGNTIRGNSGYGISLSGASLPILNNTIIGNVGGILCYVTTATLANNVIHGNTGSGVYCVSSNPNVYNNMITWNCTSTTEGGGISGHCGNHPTIVNNIVAFNSSGIANTTPTLRNNCVYSNMDFNYETGITPGPGDFSDLDPGLVAVENGEVHIQPGSPCVDGGDDTVVETGWLDMDGQTRIQGTHVDIGAHESDGTQWPVPSPVIVRVSPEGNDANDGSTWALAKRTVQAAVNETTLRGGEVWVKDGTYRECVVLLPHSSIYGGFNGSETDRSQRNPGTSPVILDGNNGGSVITARTACTHCVIDGFGIRNGSGCQSSGSSYRSGGGIYCAYSPLTVRNCTIVSNSADYGGAIYYSGRSLTVANSVVLSNSASSGGGINCWAAELKLVNNTIVGNSAFDGGGVFANPTAKWDMANNIVAFNSSGVWVAAGTTPVTEIRHNCVWGNTSYAYEGVTDPTGTNGNISVDPGLVDSSYGNTYLQSGSPCIDAGDDAYMIGSLDIGGQARKQGTQVDIGADEWDGATRPTGPYAVIHVSPDGDDGNDGSSWVSAKRTVQGGINTASLLGGEVWVKAGEYKERVSLAPYAYVYGGFAGNETDIQQRNWAANPTILDGETTGTVVSAKKCSSFSTVDGFTLQNGTGSEGGAVCCTMSSPRIANNRILGNNAYRGGAVYCEGSSADVVNNIMAANGAEYGGAVYAYGSSVNPRIINNTIVANSAAIAGAIYCNSGAPTIANNVVAFNSSGMYKRAADQPALLNNCVYGNADYDYTGWDPIPTGADGNISVDPGLASTTYGNMHIQPGSPCIDAGADDVIGAGWLDMDAQARQLGEHVDIGADESAGTTHATGPYGIVYVSPEGDDANTGLSWSEAKNSVRAGVRAASWIGGELWVKAGTYYERIVLMPFAHLYGGFCGTETEKSQRDREANLTFLDGSNAGTVITIRGGQGASTVDGFVIQKGNATYGGGVYCKYASSTIANNIIFNNKATYSGGGIYAERSSPVIENNMIQWNTAGGGAGIALDSGNPTVRGNVIHSNSATLGGGIYTSAGGIISGNEIYNNETTTKNSVSEVNCGGGGIYCYTGTALIVNNIIRDNQVLNTTGWTGGGGVYSYSSAPTIANNVIVSNTCPYYGAGLFCGYGAPAVANNIIVNNSSGIHSYSTGIVLSHNCVYGNTSYNYNNVSPGQGDVSLNPQFLSSDDYHLRPNSPCIDAANGGFAPVEDIAGNVRHDCLIVPNSGTGTPTYADIGAWEYVPANVGAADAKSLDDTWEAVIPSLVVSGVFDDHFYGQAEDRSAGIKVRSTASVAETQLVEVHGFMKTDANGERYVDAISVSTAGSVANLNPLGLTNKALGGGPCGLQAGILGASGLSNIGLLVNIWGTIRDIGTGYVMIDDGSASEVKVLLPEGLRISPSWRQMSAIGISSCEKDASGNLTRVLRARKQQDIIGMK